MFDRNQEVLEYYPTLLEAAVGFRIYSRKLLAKIQGVSYEINPEHEKIPIAEGYSIVKDPLTKNYFALKD